jgi:hypothetical protein
MILSAGPQYTMNREGWGMPDYNLMGLSSRSFEQLMQALAVKAIGPGVLVFGDGPDGGREGTYEGRMQYPSAADPWDGYLVIQAKYKQRTEGTAKDADWALGQLKSEFEKFASGQRRLRRPEYYLFCTNVVLTPAHEVGTKDRAFALAGSYRDSLPLKGFDVWDYDKIRCLLDGSPDIRRTYAAWITPGDVLAGIAQLLEEVRPSSWT